MSKTIYPRVLVISNNAFTKTGSNGRVLGNLFAGWDDDCIAQFYTSSEIPDLPVCKNYYRVTDKEALKSFLIFKKAGRRIDLSVSDVSVKNFASKSSINKNPLTSLLRDIVWNSRRWISKSFWSFIEDFNPQIIMLYMGGSSRLINLALTISDKYSIPIITYNTENYYFKDYNYFFNKPYGFIYPLYQRQFKRAYEKIIEKSSADIYLNELIRDQNNERFQNEGKVIYHSSSVDSFDEYDGTRATFLYAGNLGLNRHISLAEIGKVLKEINPDYMIDVYGKAEEHVEDFLLHSEGVNYCGVVSYDVLKTVMAEHQFLFHIESFDPNMIKDLNGAFSTKIADSLRSNRCFVVYADKSLACSQYLIKNDCACVITDKTELKSKLEQLIVDKSLQQKYINKALEVARRNHDIELNKASIYSSIVSALK